MTKHRKANIGNTYAKKDWSINDTSSLLKNKNYNKFYEQKRKLQSKYDKRLFEWSVTRPPASIKKWYLEEGRYQWREYLKEVSDLMYKDNGYFQKFLWDIISKSEVELMQNRYNYK